MRDTAWRAASLGSALVAALLLAACAAGPTVPPEARSELAPAGKVRAAINYGNPVLARKDAATGELRGVTIALSREIGTRIGAPVELVPYDTVAKLLAGLKAGEWDVAFLAVDPARAGDVQYTEPYMEVEVTYLVPGASDLRAVSQVDRPGTRIALQERNAADLFLTRTLKAATLVRAKNNAEAFALLKTGSAEAFAANRQEILNVLDTEPGYRVTDGRFTTIPHAIAVPASRAAAATWLRALVEDMKASGLVRRALDEAGTRGVVVAPPVAR